VRAYVLDSYAILVLLNNEPGAEKVESILHTAEEEEIQVFMSLISLGEVVFLVEHRWGQEKLREMVAYLETSPIEFIETDRERILEAAHIKAMHSVSYADAFAVALCLEHGATFLTGHREINRIPDLIHVDWLD
jgi:predicted nucleic acid-binding protein